MLGEILKALLITSLAGTCLTAIITALKPITKKIFGYAWHYYIWLAVLAVMLLPVRFTLPQKADTTPIAAQTAQAVQTSEITENADNVIPTVQAKPKTDMLQAGTNFMKRIIDNRQNILAYVWLTGAMMLLLINLIGYIRLIKKMRRNSVIVSYPETARFTRREIAVRVWKNMSSPFMVGLFKPTLVLPAKELTDEQLDNILRHEMTHLRRHDILYKWLVSLVKCLHWFNPAIWYVAKQVNTECEISCDMAVTLPMSKDEEMSYISTILTLLPTKKTKQLPLTTQMASSKRTLKRRFEMIKKKKRTNRLVSVLSALIAVVMLSTTVFAGGVLSDITTDDYTIGIINNGRKIEFANKPFIENGEVYLPLREIFEKLNITNNIKWNNGKIDITLSLPIDLYQNNEIIDTSKVEFFYEIQIGSDSIAVNPNSESDYISYVSYAADMQNVPVLRNDKTYITYDYMDYMLGGGAYSNKHNVIYFVYDKNGNVIEQSRNSLKTGTIIIDENNTVVYKSDDLENPENTVTGFFEAFADSNFTLMKNYCTEKCISSYFGDGYVFGITRAELAEVSIDPLEYAKSSNDFNMFVTVNMTPHEKSVFDPIETSTSFYVILQRQPDGRYLIEEFDRSFIE